MNRVKKCQYPLWDKVLPPISELMTDQHYCSKPVKDGSPYCPDHHSLCREKPDRNAPRVQWNYSQPKGNYNGEK